MQNKVRKVTCIDLMHSDILYGQLSELIGSLFVMQVGRSVVFINPEIETPQDNIRSKEIQTCTINAMVFEDEPTQEDIYNLMKEY